MSSAPGEGRHWLGKILPRLGRGRGRALALIIDGYLACLRGDSASGLAELAEGIALAEERGDARIRARGYLNLTIALAFAGRYEEAERASATAYSEALAAGDTPMLVVLDSHVGYLRMLDGKVEEGLAWCRDGLARLGPDSGERWQQSYLRLLEGMCLFLLGELRPSAEAFRTALAMKHEIADTMGAGYPLADIVRFAASDADGLPPHPAGPGGDAGPEPAAPGLTGREMEIAGLVAEGLSNRQIAERLVISKRTVDAHIEHIYGKLGVSSRVQLAGWLRSARP